MEANLRKLLYKNYYTIEELIEILGLKERQAYKAFRKIERVKGIQREDAIFRLMGGQFYL